MHIWNNGSNPSTAISCTLCIWVAHIICCAHAAHLVNIPALSTSIFYGKRIFVLAKIHVGVTHMVAAPRNTKYLYM